GDALGSVRQLVDGSGAVTLAQSYEPYGEVMGSSGSGETAYAYTGEWHSSSTNLLYLRSRYYIAETGRFLTKDTWQGDFTLPLTLNGWNYVEGNPVNFVDPTGHSRYIAYFAEFVDSYDKNNKDAPHWTQKEMMVVNSVMVKIAMAYKRAYDEMAIRKYTQWFNNKCYYLDDPINFIEPSKIDPATAFFKVHGGRVILERVTGNNGNAWGMAQTARKVYIYKKATEEKFIDPQHEPFIAHEMGHVFENAFEEIYKRTEKGAGYKPGRDLVAKSGEGDLNNRKGFGGGFLKWQFSDEISSWEIFADMYVGWLYNSWASKPTAVPESSLYNIQSSNFQAGVNKAKFMDQHMPEWVYYIISNRR
ncbi:MAG: RHS repeat-associated core domain-containing protein, partial [Veillonellaceae bacterium]|nr:RHS repeat-associated core domain-containing protein [Veillonellaceae bacterium]